MILSSALANGWLHPGQMIIFVLLLLTAGVTAFYMFRVLFLTFTGTPRDKHRYDHAHESSFVMAAPLVLLAALSIGSAWGNWFPKLVQKPYLASYAVLETGGNTGGAEGRQPAGGGEAGGLAGAQEANESAAGEAELAHLEHRSEMFAMPLSILVAGLGILFSLMTYARGFISPQRVMQSLRPVHTLLARKYYIDEIYSGGVVRPVLLLSRGMRVFDNVVIDGLVNGVALVGRLTSWITGIFDNRVVDGAVNGVAWTTVQWGRQLRRVQTGRFQSYALGAFAVALLLVLIRLARGF